VDDLVLECAEAASYLTYRDLKTVAGIELFVYVTFPQKLVQILRFIFKHLKIKYT